MDRNQFRVIVGSYEHNILCLSLDLSLATPVFTPIFHFQAHSLSVKCLDISKRYLVSGSNDEHIRIYDLQKRKELGTLMAHQGSITDLKFSTSREVTEGGNGDGKTDAVVEGSGSGSKWLLSAGDDNKIIIWRVKDWENFGALKGHTARINSIDIHPSNKVAVSVGEDHTIRLWNLMTVKKAAILKLKKYSQNGQFVRWAGENGEFFVVALLNKILVYKTATGKVVNEIDMVRKTIMHMEIQRVSGEEYLAVGLSDGNVNFYKTSNITKDEDNNNESEFALLGHSNRVKDFKFYRNEHGLYLVTIGSDGKIVVWDMDKKEQIAVYDSGERLNCLAVCDESVEKYETMKKRNSEVEDAEQSEYESDTEELKKVMFGEKKKAKKNKKTKNKKQKVSVELE
ncbi:hypothetical protein Kpol_1057p12 [Vanderwaltozyma polyspora DSM 70294]|uniref:Uncharacterized protein n=1 Tax=Vanderwaltozyma polyspora (strain ATCC 22028 / DSM 70294 / BCRC 21397 / CBS 2163 / NBRC 10782 / NRRL Y-8283 / UCD 57-17) TaxID=436907 RepID=A7TPI0_VANPO|nr:uncharacterized protein Kpol_1057p12 [Vanderwaltozyma polyspora DSM 70294]EDO15824.1 hypothetical protein Kpol_1057p12 [Vanderwaltozyma polyspora DSM 70294]